jgi:hypothetical protein
MKDIADEIANAVFDGIPEYPSYVMRKVRRRFSVYARAGDAVFRGDSLKGFPDAIADLTAQVERWRARGS